MKKIIFILLILSIIGIDCLNACAPGGPKMEDIDDTDLKKSKETELNYFILRVEGRNKEESEKLRKLIEDGELYIGFSTAEEYRYAQSFKDVFGSDFVKNEFKINHNIILPYGHMHQEKKPTQNIHGFHCLSSPKQITKFVVTKGSCDLHSEVLIKPGKIYIIRLGFPDRSFQPHTKCLSGEDNAQYDPKRKERSDFFCIQEIDIKEYQKEVAQEIESVVPSLPHVIAKLISEYAVPCIEDE